MVQSELDAVGKARTRHLVQRVGVISHLETGVLDAGTDDPVLCPGFIDFGALACHEATPSDTKACANAAAAVAPEVIASGMLLIIELLPHCDQ